MDKTRQSELVRWLKKHAAPARRCLRVSILLGVFSGLLVIGQAWCLATLLQALIMAQVPREQLVPQFFLLAGFFLARALVNALRERSSFVCGQTVRQQIRQLVLDKLEALGPVRVRGKPAGSWASIVLEQIEDMQDYYARYLPQMALAGLIPLLILVTIFPLNWAAGLILLCTAPLIPLFMALAGMGAADANRRNFLALGRLSGNFLDRLRGLETIRLFHRGAQEIDLIDASTGEFRQRTMEVLRLAFLSSAVLEFFAAVSIALVAVYFGFSYLGELQFGSHGLGVTLFAGFLVLILAPEFFQPLRDLGSYYHAKAQAVGAAEALLTLLSAEGELPAGTKLIDSNQPVSIQAESLRILAPTGEVLAGPLDFTIECGQRIAIVGHSGAGKSSLINLLLGFLPYTGSIRINTQELAELSPASWRKLIAWVGQNPHLPEPTILDNLRLGHPDASMQAVQRVMDQAYVSEFIAALPEGVHTLVGEHAARLSVGQAQRIAVARALLDPCQLLLLDEPAASLDAHSEERVMAALAQAARQQTTLLVTHQLDEVLDYDQVWVMEKGRIIEQGTYSTLKQQGGAFARLLAHRQEAL